MPMLCVTINGPSFEEAAQQILSLPLNVHLLEFRLDCFFDLNESFLERLRGIRALPVIFTLREPRQGSDYQGTEEERLAALTRYAKLNPEYIDLESTCPPDYIRLFSEAYPHIKIILSYHNFDETPADLTRLYAEMRTFPAHFYKIATFCNSSTDALRLLFFTKNAVKPLCTMGMGRHGEVTRVLGCIYGSSITYASVSDKSKIVQGQLSANTLSNVYHYPLLNSETLVYGLIGDPVSKSIGYRVHNAFFANVDIPAVYVKMVAIQDQLEKLLPLTKELGFRGLSVTMPLKEVLLPHVDFIDPYAASIGAANTLVYKEDGIHAYNTDGIGALNAIEKIASVNDKRVLIVGAGGAAKAIIVEALRRGAHVTVVNRTVSRAEELALQYSIRAAALSDITQIIREGYDFLINCTPVGIPFDLELLLPEKIVMDIKTLPQLTEFLAKAIEKKCLIVYGYQMYIEQALEQYALWFPEIFNRTQAKQLLEHVVKNILSEG